MDKEKNAFEIYTDMQKAWGDIFTSWSKSMNSTPFFRTDMDSWFSPFQNYFGDWNGLYKGFGKTMTGFPLPYESMNEYSRGMMQGINSYVKTYEIWIRNMDKIGRKQFELIQGLSTGKKVNVAELFDIMNESYFEITGTLLDSMRGTPLEDAFKGTEQIKKALKQFVNSFPEEQKKAKEIFQTFSTHYTKAINSWTALMMDSNKRLSDMLSKGEMSVEAYNTVINEYGEAFKESMGTLLGPLSSLLPDYKDMVDDLTDWTNKYFNLLSSWIGIPLKLLQGIGKSSREMHKFADDMFRKGEKPSQKEFYNAWSEFYKKVSVDLMNNVQLDTTLPNFLVKYTEYIKATNKMYERTMTPLFPGKEEMHNLYASIEEIANKVEKKEVKVSRQTSVSKKTE